MRCMYCGYKESKVIDSRSTEEGETIRRRREYHAEKIYNREKVETVSIDVIKDNTRQPFDRNSCFQVFSSM